MKVAAIICEYNPFHLGHIYHINMTRKSGCTHIVAVMSGDFVQRGEAAIMSKWERTRSALNSGVDLVLELPTLFSMSYAEKFAMGAVKILDSLGTVDFLSFGSECSDENSLRKVSIALLSQEFERNIRVHLNKGITFAKARELALVDTIGENFASVVKNPNDTLAVEYIKSLVKINSDVSIMPIKRLGSCHDSLSTEEGFGSASFVRKLIKQNKLDELTNFLSSASLETVKRELTNLNAPADMSYAERAIMCRLRLMSREDLRNVMDVSEGIENRIFDGVKKSASLEELYDFVKTKRYTHARIRRIVLAAFLGITKAYKNVDPLYIRVLGFNDKGIEVLHKSKQKTTLPIITRASDVKKLSITAKELFDMELKFESLYSAFTPSLKSFDFRSAIYVKDSQLKTW